MKKHVIIMVSAIVIFLACVSCYAEEKDLSVTMILKNNWIKPKSGDGFFTQGLWTLIQKGNIGGGFDSSFDYKNGFYQFNPYIIYGKGPWFGVVGTSSDNNGNNFAQIGFWYVKTHQNKLFTFVDIRNYFVVGGKQNSYLDAFAEFTYPISDKFYGGIDLEYLKWWDSSSHQGFFAGPLIGYKISKNVHVYLRGSRSWDRKENSKTETDQAQLGFKFMF